MNDADRLRVILGTMYEYGMGGPFGGDKARVVEQGLHQLAELLDIEFDEAGDIVSICGTDFLWHTGERPEGE